MKRVLVPFFTNYESHKGKELDANPQATIVFFWKRTGAVG
jgi:pyridoxine/pyridoxamine 5'-phosphate oxidase